MFASAFLLSAAFTPALPPPDTAAETALRRMDDALARAGTLRIDFQISSPEGDLFRGKLLLADRNRFRVEMTSPQADPDVVGLMICDGKQLIGGKLVDGLLQPDGDPQAVPAWVGEVIRSWLGRGGTFLTLGDVLRRVEEQPDASKPGRGEGPRASGARLLPDERVNGVEARVVEYDLGWNKEDPAEDVRVRVWIDKKTDLPVRRTMTVKSGDAFTAVHTRMEVGVKFEDSLFELPK